MRKNAVEVYFSRDDAALEHVPQRLQMQKMWRCIAAGIGG